MIYKVHCKGCVDKGPGWKCGLNDNMPVKLVEQCKYFPNYVDKNAVKLNRQEKAGQRITVTKCSIPKSDNVNVNEVAAFIRANGPAAKPPEDAQVPLEAMIKIESIEPQVASVKVDTINRSLDDLIEQQQERVDAIQKTLEQEVNKLEAFCDSKEVILKTIKALDID